MGAYCWELLEGIVGGEECISQRRYDQDLISTSNYFIVQQITKYIDLRLSLILSSFSMEDL